MIDYRLLDDVCVPRLAAETFGLPADKIVQRELDVNVAMVLGAGFPDFRGGVLRYAREMGLKNVTNQFGELAARLGARCAPCAPLRRMEGVQ